MQNPSELFTLDDYKQHARKMICKTGPHLHFFEHAVLGLPFEHTVGVQYHYNAPEIIVIGAEEGHSRGLFLHLKRVLNSGAYKTRSNDIYQFTDLGCHVLEVDRKYHEQYLDVCQWFYGGDNFTALQIVYPMTTGLFPWDSRAPEWFRMGQPLLGTVPTFM